MAINPVNQEANRLAAQANQDYNHTQTLQGQLPMGVLRSILSNLSQDELDNAALTCRRWREAANGDNGVALCTRKAKVLKYLDNILGQLDRGEYEAQLIRLVELRERFRAMPPAEYRHGQTLSLIKREIIDILCEAGCDDLDQMQFDQIPLIPLQQDIIEVAKRTFKGDMSVSPLVTEFTGAPMEGTDYTVDLSGRSFVLERISRTEGTKKGIVTDESFLYILPNRADQDSMMIRFPRSVDTAMLRDKVYGDTVEFNIENPMTMLGGPAPRPLHLKLRLVRQPDQREDETLDEAVQRILDYPERNIDRTFDGNSFMTPEGHVYDRNAADFRGR